MIMIRSIIDSRSILDNSISGSIGQPQVRSLGLSYLVSFVFMTIGCPPNGLTVTYCGWDGSFGSQWAKLCSLSLSPYPPIRRIAKTFVHLAIFCVQRYSYQIDSSVHHHRTSMPRLEFCKYVIADAVAIATRPKACERGDCVPEVSRIERPCCRLHGRPTFRG